MAKRRRWTTGWVISLLVTILIAVPQGSGHAQLVTRLSGFTTLPSGVTSVTGGTPPVRVIVTLTDPAPPNLVVNVTSSDRSVALPPMTVFVGEGRLNQSFTFQTFPVTTTTPVTITATLGRVSIPLTLTILPPPLLLPPILLPAIVAGGKSSAGTIQLLGSVPSGGTEVTLSSSDSNLASVPASVTVAPGANTATFVVTTRIALAGSQSVSVTITARLSSTTQTATLTIIPSASTTAVPVRIATFRPSTREWLLRGDAQSVPFGGPGDRPVPADYLGLGYAQIAVFRPSTGQWFIRKETGNTEGPIQFSLGSPSDVPVPADYFGRRRSQIAVFSPRGEWLLRNDDGTGAFIAWGTAGDIPVPGDYLGLGRAQIAVYRPSTGQWFIRNDNGTATIVQLGAPGDVPVPADYLGLGRLQMAVLRRSSAVFWYIRKDDGSAVEVQFGGPNDLPVPGDYLGAGRAQIAVFRTTTQEWIVHFDDGTASPPIQWGGPGDEAVPARFNPVYSN